MRPGVSRGTTTHSGRPIETEYIDVANPYKVSIGGSANLIMPVASQSKCMWSLETKNKSKTKAHVKMFIADMNNVKATPLFPHGQQRGVPQPQPYQFQRLRSDYPGAHGSG